jgi:hypothetical protein
MRLLPRSAVFASLVQVCSRSPCRLSVPRISMMPRSPIVLMSSPGTLSVSVMVALWVCGPGLAADLQLAAAQVDPLGRQLEVALVGEASACRRRSGCAAPAG